MKKVFGDFPFFDAAYIGGNHTVRRIDPDRYAGDMSAYAASELRIPLVRFALFVPMQAGVLGTAEAARVYVNSSSPGGWHTAAGGGVWVGLTKQGFIVSCTVTNEAGQQGVHCQTGLGI
jgi:hemolysin activation/secretion protein